MSLTDLKNDELLNELLSQHQAYFQQGGCSYDWQTDIEPLLVEIRRRLEDYRGTTPA